MANLRAILLMTAAMACFAVSDAFINRAAITVPSLQILVVTCAMIFAVFLVMLRLRGERLFTRQVFDRAVLIRTTGEVVGSFGFVTSLTLLPLATASAVLQAQPLVVTMAAAIFLGETVGLRRWFAVGLGFVGVMMIIRPGTDVFDPNVLWTLLGIAGLTARDLGTRMLPKDISTPFVSAWAMLALGVFAAIGMAISSPWQPVDAAAWGWMVGVTVTVALAFLTITAALRVGEVSAVAPFRYTRMVFALILAMAFLGERPDAMTLLGTGLIILSGLYAFWREQQRARQA